MESIADFDKQVLDLMLDEDSIEENIDLEVGKADELMSKYNTPKFRVEPRMSKDCFVDNPSAASSVSSHISHLRSVLKLPKIEFTKFGGDIKDWLQFWSQFKRINDDESLENEDKFQYLIQATIPISRAYQLVKSYPPIAENYPNVIDSLKSRFGKDELLVEFYVPELLKLVLNNSNTKVSLSTLFDKVESQLRALETLGVTSENSISFTTGPLSDSLYIPTISVFILGN
ncbi:unnamed protein product [Phaedon cochleariae]|uniref:Uncharacterized protein n=1 Tax=Phaedon cochleariae TaxID=80249 RepID=A0A9N9SH71_PHACE|nr:unnamed protein product [Phaedon cochleariae]